MNRVKEGLPRIESFRITHAAGSVSVSEKREVALGSPRTYIAYSFWLSWRWLRNKARNKFAKGTI